MIGAIFSPPTRRHDRIAMPTRLAWIAWLALAPPLIGASGDDRLAQKVEVVVDRLDVLVEPDDEAFVSGRLDRGMTVEVRRVLADGWLAVAAPAGTFCWVDDDAVRLLPDGRVVVTALKTTVRAARDGAARPGPGRSVASRGATFTAVKQPLLTYGDGAARKVWRAVVVEGDDVRFIRAAGVTKLGAIAIAPPVARPVKSSPREPVAERLASHVAGDPADLPPELVAPVRNVDDARRAIAAGPVEQWDFAAVRRDYQALLTGRSDEAARAAISRRIDEATREDELAKSARDFVAKLKTSRKRDAEIDRIKRSITEIRAADEQAFDAEGLLQTTAFRVEGERVYLLLNDEGRVVTYLRIPPGVDTASLMSRHVGVRGRSRFNDMLKFRLLDVRDIDALDAGR